MPKQHVKYLLIGGGQACSSAAEAIRRVDRDGEILLVGLESVRPYRRTALSGALLARHCTRDDVFTHPADWFAAHHVQLRTATRVARLDLSRRSALLASGEEIGFDRLLLGTGATPKKPSIPGTDLPGVSALRTLDDVVHLQHTVDHALASGRRHKLGIGRGRATVMGANLLGTQVAATLTRMGLEVTLVVGRPHPWSRVVGEVTGRFVSHRLEQNGVTVLNGTYATSLEGDGRVQRVALDNGTSVDCDLVVCATGVSPNRALVRNTSIRAENAIVVDATCQTSEPGIYAAGDCAAVFDPAFNKHRWTDLYDTASMTGGIAGMNMTGVAGMNMTGVAGANTVGAKASFDDVTRLSADLFDLRLRAFGEARFVDRHVMRGKTGADSMGFIEIGVASDGRVSQVVVVGQVGEPEPSVVDFVRRRPVVDGHEERLKDTGTPLESFVGNG